MAIVTEAGTLNETLGVVIAFGIAVSTVLGRFVIPIYYVLGERVRGSRPSPVPRAPTPPGSEGHAPDIHAAQPDPALA